MATTPNFNWSTPDNTGLVKNGALDIRTLGNSIDASMADLKGGTTGQVLSKTSNTDMDFSWVAQDDSNAIQNAIVDAKGDLIAASANDTPARLAVGSNFSVLTAQSTETTGLQWVNAVTAYTPTWTASGVAPVLGNGQLAGYYQRFGKLCYVRMFFQAGSTTTFGTGTWFFSLPFTGAAGLPLLIGSAYVEDFATAAYSVLVKENAAGTNIILPTTATATNAEAGPTFPITWGTNDFFHATFTYEVA